MYDYPMTPPKSRIRSKTYWVNALVMALMAVETQFYVLQPLVPVNVYLLVAFLLPVANLVLRELTDRGVAPIRVGNRQWPPAHRPAGAARPEEHEEEP